MDVGLKKILEQIADDASNETLVQRYLSLVAEINDDSDKVQPMLLLVQITLESDPFAALRHALMIIKFDPKCVPALTAAVKALTNLGRFAKAEVLRNEIQRLKSEIAPRSPQPVRGSDESPVANAMAATIKIDPQPVAIRETVQPTPASEPARQPLPKQARPIRIAKKASASPPPAMLDGPLPSALNLCEERVQAMLAKGMVRDAVFLIQTECADALLDLSHATRMYTLATTVWEAVGARFPEWTHLQGIQQLQTYMRSRPKLGLGFITVRRGAAAS